MDKGTEWSFLKRRQTNSQQMLAICTTDVQKNMKSKNINQNHKEISPHTCYNSYFLFKIIIGKDLEKRKTLHTVGRAIKEKNMEVF
jgi:hypothetical protein